MKYKTALFSTALSIVFVGVFLVGNFALSDQYGLTATADEAGLSQQTDIPSIIGNVIGAGLSLVSVLFFILMIYGGIRWMLSRGKEDEAKKALDTIVAAIIGIIIVLASYAITTFVFKSVGSQGGGGGGNTGNTPTTSVCVQKFGGAGLGCYAKTECSKTPANAIKVQDAILNAKDVADSVKLGSEFVVEGGENHGAYYIVNSCPGSADVVCCIK